MTQETVEGRSGGGQGGEVGNSLYSYLTLNYLCEYIFKKDT